MKDALHRRIGIAVLAGTLAPAGAYAFVDERTPKPPPAPAPTQVIAPAATGTPVATLTPAATPSVSAITQSSFEGAAVKKDPVAETFKPGVMGDIGAPVWKTTYPGPYGTMPLADALIAQIVPVVGGVIELNGPSQLLGKSVTLVKGQSRIQTLTTLAKANNLGIMIQGNMVSLASPLTPEPLLRSNDVAMAGTGVVTKAEPLKETKTWDIPAGAMLSSALLDWSNKWGWKLIWKADVDYRIVAPIQVTGDFLDTVGKVIDAYRLGDRPLWGDWNSDQKVLVVREPNARDLND